VHLQGQGEGVAVVGCTAELMHQGLCRARTRTMALSWYFLRSSGRSPILVDQPVDDLPTPDPAGDVDRLARLMQRRSLFARLVRTMFVVMP